MSHAASRPRHRTTEEGLWFVIAIAAIMALSFVAVFLFIPK